MNELTLQIKPVGNHCNICCKYCYAAPFKSSKFEILDIKILDKLIKEALEMTNQIVITWHGGEPTMVGLDYFKEYLKIVKKYKKSNQKVYNMIQTNATLIDDDMAEFFKKNDFNVSISLDGIKEVNDKYRVRVNGKGTFDEVMKGVSILRAHGINPPVIITVTKDNIDKAAEIFDFIVKNNFKEIKFSPVYDKNDDLFSINNAEWYSYTKIILEQWLNLQDNNIKVREIDELLSWFAGDSFALCTVKGLCARWISIDEKGNVYPCEYMRNTNSYGNLKDGHLAEVFSSENYKSFVKKINFYPGECRK